MLLDRIDHTRSALAHAVAVSTWRQALTVGKADATVAPAVRVGLAVAIVLLGGGILGRHDLAGFAALGALCSAFGRYEPYPRRAGKIALVGALIVVYATLGAALGAATTSAIIQVLAISVAAGVAALLLTAFAITGPGAVVLIFAATAAVGFSHAVGDLGTVFVSVAIGAVVGWTLSMAPAILHPTGPSQLAVARALAALDRRDAPGARAAIARARTVVALDPGDREHRRGLTTLLDDADAVLDAWSRGEDPSHAAEVLAHERHLRRMRRYRVPTAGEFSAESPPHPTPRNFFAEGVTQAASTPIVRSAARITVAAALAALCATALGFEHPLWATMGAMAAMHGIDYHTTVQRGIQRLLGNVGGAVIAAVLIASSLGYWETVVVIVVMQVAAELLVMKNYALTSLAITPMALLMTGLAGHLSPSVSVSRIGDTLVGVVIGICVAALTVERADRHHLV
ncbi:FUSC family protein [Rhodococcus sp. 06-156-3C]|uniref:FUSC family protein n=1 Tax=Nocardiaceae TaxID=85025 RepID=UPI000522E53C|nr:MULTISPECIES: FUSC family protein [Rhodococcus]OZD11244.1 FUSC family protein [Rhodococcus sp. 06-156-3C]OZD13475.1 FUSC family protein [Rhodococcus sp. 06-156-4a]OZD22182.1 FUSC family protein [Rhodococcus sp. 06-156-4C]OZD30102.1 FUSC family protein [Rhodococcus sp. 06-156-3]OZD37507.1 FUSC family protein [Rhodococcus sp. 06-156-3b]